LENVQGKKNELHKAASPFLDNPPRRIHYHINKRNGKCPPSQFFPDNSTDVDNENQKNTRAQITDLRSPDSQSEPNFTEHEVEEVISKLDESKSPGPDGIDGKIVKQLHKYLPKFLLALYNKCFALGCFPKVWKKVKVTAVPKADKTKLRSVEGYRGISLLSIPGKCLEN